MLIGIFCALALAASGLTCLGTNAFCSLHWLWALPLTFLGSFLVLCLLWFLLLFIMAKAVDMEKEQENDSPFYRAVINLTIPALVTLFRIHIHVEGMEKLPKNGRFMLVCNHLNDTDPIVLLWAMRKSQLAFISKKENDQKFLVGPFMRKLLCQPIDRENDRAALKTILRCIALLKEDKISLGVFPEGYCSRDHLLHPFRSGVFKIAQKAQLPILVCTVRDTHHIFHNMLRLKPSRVELHLLEVIPAETLTGRTAVDIADQVHRIMAADLGPELVLQAGEGEISS